MMPHSAHHETLMQSFVTGETDEASPAMRELRDCPVCREQLEDLRELTASLGSAARERREILTECMATPASASDDVSQHVRAGLRERAAPARPVGWQALMMLAAVLVVGVVWWAPWTGSSTPSLRDRLLGVTAASPRGDDVRELTRFEWPGHPDETYEVHLFTDDDPLNAWRVLPSEGNHCRIDADLASSMRGHASTWYWHYERTSAQQPGSDSVPRSETWRFTFSR